MHTHFTKIGLSCDIFLHTNDMLWSYLSLLALSLPVPTETLGLDTQGTKCPAHWRLYRGALFGLWSTTLASLLPQLPAGRGSA